MDKNIRGILEGLFDPDRYDLDSKKKKMIMRAIDKKAKNKINDSRFIEFTYFNHYKSYFNISNELDEARLLRSVILQAVSEWMNFTTYQESLRTNIRDLLDVSTTDLLGSGDTDLKITRASITKRFETRFKHALTDVVYEEDLSKVLIKDLEQAGAECIVDYVNAWDKEISFTDGMLNKL